MFEVEHRVIRLRYPGRCAGCGTELPRGAEATWDATSKVAICLTCSETTNGSSAVSAAARATERPDPVELGGGGSAQREHDRRSANREARIREAHPKIGGLIVALSDDPTSTRVWAKGAEGERRVARRLNELTAEGIVVLHDRRIPGSRANIDHIAIAPSGVHVIDSKRYNGRVELRHTGTLFRPGPDKLYVNGRDQTKLLDGMRRQIAAVHAAVGDEVAESDTMITAVLCFVDTEWGLLTKPFKVDGIQVTWPKALVVRIRQPGPLTAEQVATLAERLSQALPVA